MGGGGKEAEGRRDVRSNVGGHEGGREGREAQNEEQWSNDWGMGGRKTGGERRARRTMFQEVCIILSHGITGGV